MNKLLIILTFLLSVTGISQNINFIKSYGNNGYDFGRDIKQDVDTGYIATGSSSSFGSGTADAFLLKVDSMGNFKWSYNYGGQNTDWGESVVVTNDSSYAIGGYTNSFGSGGFDFYLVRADKDGTPLWEKTYGGSSFDVGRSIKKTQDGGYLLAGSSRSQDGDLSTNNGQNDAWVFKVSSNGTKQWQQSLGGSQIDFAYDVIENASNEIIFVGESSSSDFDILENKGFSDLLIAKIK